MNRLLLPLALTVRVSSVLCSHPTAAQPRPAGELAERVQILDGPGLESATEHAAILRWTTNTGRGPVVHYGVVQYGTDPKNLSQVAAAPPSPSGKRRTVRKWMVPASQGSRGAASLVRPV